MRHTRGYALKALSFLLAPFFFGMLVATTKGWQGLVGRPRLLAGWAVLLLLAVVFPLFLALAGRVAMGHEPARADRRALGAGVASLTLAAVAVFLVPWRELGDWMSATLSEMTGMPFLLGRPRP